MARVEPDSEVGSIYPCGACGSNVTWSRNAVLLVLRDQQKYSEKSENIIGLDPYILNSFSYLDPI